MVETFRWTAGGLHRLDATPDMAAASANLPPGAYTTLRTYGGDGVVRLAEHARRLRASVEGGAPPDFDQGSVRSAVAGALAATRHPESRLRLTLAPPDLYVSVEPFTPLPESLYRQGASCVTVPLRRARPQAKDTRFIAAAHDAYATLPDGIHEGLLIGEDGALLEGLSSNVFAIRDGILHTEDERALAGVTRSLVLEAARDLLPLATRAVRLPQLREIDECFLTSVTREVLPVTRIDTTVIGTGFPGPRTAEIRSRFDSLVARETEHLWGPRGA